MGNTGLLPSGSIGSLHHIHEGGTISHSWSFQMYWVTARTPMVDLSPGMASTLLLGGLSGHNARRASIRPICRGHTFRTHKATTVVWSKGFCEIVECGHRAETFRACDGCYHSTRTDTPLEGLVNTRPADDPVPSVAFDAGPAGGDHMVEAVSPEDVSVFELVVGE